MIDLTYLSLGGGVQSTTIAEMIVEGELPLIDFAIFSDTGDEPVDVYANIEYLTTRLASVGVPVHVVSKGNIVEDLYGDADRFTTLPVHVKNQDGTKGIMRRQCTNDYKIRPITKKIKRILNDMGLVTVSTENKYYVKRGTKVVCMIGISLDEWERMKPSRHTWTEHTWPLIDKRMTRKDCISWLEIKGLPVPGKSSCIVCPFHNDDHWWDVKHNHPGDWDHACEFDAWMRTSSPLAQRTKGEVYLHKSLVPLSEVELEDPSKRWEQISMFDDAEICDEGYCFI